MHAKAWNLLFRENKTARSRSSFWQSTEHADTCAPVDPCSAKQKKFNRGPTARPILRFPQNSWDIAAGALLIQEAGGEMSDILGDPYCLSTRAIIGSNKLVHEDVRLILVEADATRPDSTPQL